MHKPSVMRIHLVTKFSTMYVEVQRKKNLNHFRNKQKGSKARFWIFPASKIHLSKFLLLNKIMSKSTTEHKRVLFDTKKLHSNGS